MTLTFGWKPGVTAHIECAAYRIRTSATQEDTLVVMKSACRMRLLPAPDGILVATDSVQIRFMAEYGRSQWEQFADSLAVILSSMNASFVVSAKGDFVRVVHPESVRAAGDSVFALAMSALRADSLPPEAMTTLKNLRTQMSASLEDKEISASAMSDWTSQWGLWLGGAPLILNDVYELETTGEIPGISGTSVPMRMRGWALRAPCTADDNGSGCLELDTESRPDSAKWKAVRDDLIRKYAGAHSRELQDILYGADSGISTSLLVEPTTLLPLGYMKEKSVTLAGSSDGSRDVTILRYTYYENSPLRGRSDHASSAGRVLERSPSLGR